MSASTVSKDWRSQNTLTKKKPCSFHPAALCLWCHHKNCRLQRYTLDFTHPTSLNQPEIYLLHFSFFFLRDAFISLSRTSGPLPTDRRTHWLKDVTIATREKKQKRCTVRSEKERMQRDGGRQRESPKLKDGETEWDRKSRQMEKQRKSVGWRRNSVSLRPRSHRPKFWAALTVTTEDVSLRLPPSPFFTLSIHNC